MYALFSRLAGIYLFVTLIFLPDLSWSGPTMRPSITLAIPIDFNKSTLIDVESLYHAESSRALHRIEQAFNRLGYDVNFEYYPGKRSLQLANSGSIDGELARTREISETYKNLRIVTEYKKIKPAIYGRGQGSVTLLQSITFQRGSVYEDLPLPDILSDVSIVKTNGLRQSIHLVMSGRVDALLTSENVYRVLNELSPADANALHRLPITIEAVSVFTFLHKKHESLIPELRKAIEIIGSNEKF